MYLHNSPENEVGPDIFDYFCGYFPSTIFPPPYDVRVPLDVLSTTHAHRRLRGTVLKSIVLCVQYLGLSLNMLCLLNCLLMAFT
jgi:hypothetical protein